MSNSPRYGAGLDIGGTTIKAMLVNEDGWKAGEPVEVRSHVDAGYERAIEVAKEKRVQIPMMP